MRPQRGAAREIRDWEDTTDVVNLLVHWSLFTPTSGLGITVLPLLLYLTWNPAGSVPVGKADVRDVSSS
jgi:hypothetical protein